MNNVEKLVAALRSGEFRQGQRQLRTDNSFCCLGVACELYRREVGGQWIHSGVRWCFEPLSGSIDSAYLPPAVRDWLGIVDVDGGYADDSGTLAQDNDAGLTFAQIADKIEKIGVTLK